jgi:hypothetical protein
MASSPVSGFAPCLLCWLFCFSLVVLYIFCIWSRALILALLLISGIQPHPCPSSNHDPIHTFLQFNGNGIRNSPTEINNFLQTSKVKVACIQETRLTSTAKSPSFPDYSFLRKDRPVGRRGGLAILIHNSVLYTPLDTTVITQNDASLELLAITATINGSPINIFNIYIPPSSSCPPLYQPNFDAILNFSDADSIFLGNFNAHSVAWFSATSSSQDAVRGDNLALAVVFSVP